MSFPCAPGIAHFILGMTLCTKPAKVHAYVLETRDACDGEKKKKRKKRKIRQIAIASDSRPHPRTGLALLICRARDVARTAHHARHARHATRTRNAITRRRRTQNSNSRLGDLMLRFHGPNLRYNITHMTHKRKHTLTHSKQHTTHATHKTQNTQNVHAKIKAELTGLT